MALPLVAAGAAAATDSLLVGPGPGSGRSRLLSAMPGYAWKVSSDTVAPGSNNPNHNLVRCEPL